MIKSVPFKRDHAALIDLNEAYDGQRAVLASYSDMSGFMVETILWEPKYGGQSDVLAVFAGAMVVDGNFEISALIGNRAKHYPLQFFRHTLRRVEHYENVLNLRRMQSTIRSGFPFLVKWIELLGFQREAVMRKFGPEGDNYYMYARVKP